MRSIPVSVENEVSAHSKLGSREREVLQLIAEGKTSAEAARGNAHLYQDRRTHRRNLGHKLGLHGTAGDEVCGT
jgi:DNA-binding CsgD family transcriptional regulator